jgi:high-affinity iron transporter
MFLNTVILFLQEILEAALLVSVLLVLTTLFHRSWGESFRLRRRWMAYALLLGSAGAWAYAAATPTVADWFDYVGQDVLNSLLHLVSLLTLVLLTGLVPARSIRLTAAQRASFAVVCMTVIVLLALVREGSEIILYLGGVLGQAGNASPVLAGAAIGAGIGVSCGVFLFYSLISLSPRWSLRICVLLLALISGNMASQIVMLLSQADWLPYTPIAWNSSALVAESSITGHLLYAFIGYEATPSLLQVASYVVGVLVILAGPLFRVAWSESGPSEDMAAM